MNIPFLIAGIVATIGTLSHAFGGEYAILRHIQSKDLPHVLGEDGDSTKRYIRGFWHVFTADLALSAAALFYLALTDFTEPAQLLARFIALHYIVYTLVIWTIAIGRPIHLSRTATQWVAFLTIAVLTFWGTWRGV